MKKIILVVILSFTTVLTVKLYAQLPIGNTNNVPATLTINNPQTETTLNPTLIDYFNNFLYYIVYRNLPFVRYPFQVTGTREKYLYKNPKLFINNYNNLTTTNQTYITNKALYRFKPDD
jgi:hypothetical protein